MTEGVSFDKKGKKDIYKAFTGMYDRLMITTCTFSYLWFLLYNKLYLSKISSDFVIKNMQLKSLSYLEQNESNIAIFFC